MHSQDIIADQHVPLLPRVIIRNAAVVQQPIELVTDRLALPALVRVVDRHYRRIELGLGLRPRLVVP